MRRIVHAHRRPILWILTFGSISRITQVTKPVNHQRVRPNAASSVSSQKCLGCLDSRVETAKIDTSAPKFRRRERKMESLEGEVSEHVSGKLEGSGYSLFPFKVAPERVFFRSSIFAEHSQPVLHLPSSLTEGGKRNTLSCGTTDKTVKVSAFFFRYHRHKILKANTLRRVSRFRHPLQRGRQLFRILLRPSRRSLSS